MRYACIILLHSNGEQGPLHSKHYGIAVLSLSLLLVALCELSVPLLALPQV